MEHVPETLRRRGRRFARRGCVVSENLKCAGNAFIDSCPRFGQAFLGMRLPFLSCGERSGARVPRVGGTVLVIADFVEAQKLRPPANSLKDCFGATPRSTRETRPGVSAPGYTRSPAFARATAWQPNHFSLLTSHLESALITAASGATVEWGAAAV